MVQPDLLRTASSGLYKRALTYRTCLSAHLSDGVIGVNGGQARPARACSSQRAAKYHRAVRLIASARKTLGRGAHRTAPASTRAGAWHRGVNISGKRRKNSRETLAKGLDSAISAGVL